MRKPAILKHAYVQEISGRNTSFGYATYIKIARHDGKRMSWTEVWTVFTNAYPNQWAIQAFPPKDMVVDHVNTYHLFVLAEEPTGININWRRS
jgi:hypothetical protein